MDKPDGVFIRATGAYLVEDKSLVRVTLTIDPVPAGPIEMGLAQHLMNEARAWLMQQGVIGAEFTDLTVQGPMQ